MDMMRGKSGRYDEELDGGGDQQDEVSKGTTYVSSATPLVEKVVEISMPY